MGRARRRWRFGEEEAGNRGFGFCGNIPGATSASYTVASADGSDFVSHSVVVGNFEGSATSGSANMMVTGLPIALFIHASSGPNASDLAAIERIQTLGLQMFEGELDDIAIWNRVVTAEEVATLYKGGEGTAISSLAGINAPIVTSVTRSGSGISLQWVPAGGTLESSPTLGAGAVWTPVGTANPASIPAGTGAAYYRVRK